ncbi:unnamed protein product [Heterobilharzia americana]|nr:unnamed protein product [Heterobilharzia americana]
MPEVLDYIKKGKQLIYTIICSSKGCFSHVFVGTTCVNGKKRTLEGRIVFNFRLSSSSLTICDHLESERLCFYRTGGFLVTVRYITCVSVRTLCHLV